MALQVEDPFPDSLNLLLQGADGLQCSLGLRGQVTSRVARLPFQRHLLVVQFAQAGVEARGQGIQFDQGGVSTEDRIRGGLMHARPPLGLECWGEAVAWKSPIAPANRIASAREAPLSWPGGN